MKNNGQVYSHISIVESMVRKFYLNTINAGTLIVSTIQGQTILRSDPVSFIIFGFEYQCEIFYSF